MTIAVDLGRKATKPTNQPVIIVDYRGQYESPSKSNWTQSGPIASRGGSVQIFLRQHIATCDFPEDGGGGLYPMPPLLDPPMTKVNFINCTFSHGLVHLIYFPDTYDGLAVAGGMGEGHIPCSAIEEMIRVVKSGMLFK